MRGAFALLALPFATALRLVCIHAYFGIQALRHNVMFVDPALAKMADDLALVLALLLAPGFFTRLRSRLRNKRAQALPKNT